MVIPREIQGFAYLKEFNQIQEMLYESSCI
jgi:hypothetical protein